MFAPFGNQTSNQTATWHAEPPYRGTFSILSTSLTTLALCVWTAILLNIPEQGKEYLQKYRKAGWLILGLLAPEYVAWNACEQHAKAFRIMQAVHGVYPQAPTIPWYRRAWRSCTKVLSRCSLTHAFPKQEMTFDPSASSEESRGPPRHHQWTLTHAFYAVMGGFAVQASDLGLSHPSGMETIVLNERSILSIIDRMPSWLPDISKSEILDKSKTSTLAKSVVCWQVLWFCIQCAARLMQGASISLLELNVLSHCLLITYTYSTWWSKPDGIDRPTFLTASDELREHIALCYLFSGQRDSLPELPNQFSGARNSPRISMAENELPPEHRRCDESLAPHDHSLYNEIVYRMPFGPGITSRISAVRCFQSRIRDTRDGDTFLFLKIHQFWIRYHWHNQDFDRLFRAAWFNDTEDIVFDLDPKMAERLDQARNASPLLSENENWNRFMIGSSLVHSGRIKNWSLVPQAMTSRKAWAFVFAVIVFDYGALHFLAFNAPFHTEIERTLWQLSSMTVAIIGPLCRLAYDIVVMRTTWLGNSPRDMVRRTSTLFLVFCLLLCLFARVYLISECFIQLAYLPDAAFKTANFTLYMPHFA